MFERYTDRARKVVQLANQEAKRFNHEFVGTEHLLLGIVKEGSGVAGRVLENMGVLLRTLRIEVEKVIVAGPDMMQMGRLPMTPRAKRVVVELAPNEAEALGHNYVGTEHVLLALLREEEGVAAYILKNMGLKIEGVTNYVRNVLGTANLQQPWLETEAKPAADYIQTSGASKAALAGLSREDRKAIVASRVMNYAREQCQLHGLPVVSINLQMTNV